MFFGACFAGFIPTNGPLLELVSPEAELGRSFGFQTETSFIRPLLGQVSPLGKTEVVKNS